MRTFVLLVLALAGCNSGNACDGIGGTCIDLKVTGAGDVDSLAVTLTLPGVPISTMQLPAGGTDRTSLPVHVALHINETASGLAEIAVIGFLSGTQVGAGATTVEVTAGQHTSVTVDIGGAGSDGGTGPVLTPILLVQHNKVDLLFMVDNSPGMSPKQAELMARFPELTKVLDNFGKTSPAWYHIGVVSSDLGAGQYNLGGGQCHPNGDNGQLQLHGLGAAASPTCLPLADSSNFIDYNQINNTSNLPAGQDLATTFGCMMSVGDKGCGFEHQLESVYRALHDQTAQNAGFLRSDALLAVVFLTDEDDCSADATTDLFSPSTTQYGALLSYRCTNYGIFTDGNASTPAGLMPYGSSNGPLMNPRGAPTGVGKLFDVARYINFFGKPASQGGVKADPSTVFLGAITAPPTDVESLLANPNGQPPGPYITCPGPADGKTCAVVLQHSCIAPTNTQFFGDPAVRIDQVLNAVGGSQITSVCDASYQVALQSLGAKIVSKLGAPGCLPQPPKNTVTPNCVVTDNTTNPDGSTTGTPLPMCGAPPCWTLMQDSTCGGGYRLVVTRSGSTPPNTVTTGACELVQ